MIAEQFAHAPRLDPSGTSWLPFPFWATGTAMMIAGRSLDVARAAALALSGMGAVLVHAALRAAGVARVAALGGVIVAMATPWNAWLGAATVPEGFTGAFVAAAAIGVSAKALRPWVLIALGCASLSRYEVWPACLVVALWGISRFRHREAWPQMAPCLAPMLGPIAWMAWNAYAHGSATHFLSRVANYRRAIGAAAAPMSEQLLVYPRALLEAPEIVLVAIVGFIAWALVDTMRARWTLPLVVAAAVLAFLMYGEMKDGAPTHHPERALVSIWWILAPFGIDGARELAMRVRKGETFAGAIVAAMALVSIAGRSSGWSPLPMDAESSRREQIARGHSLRAEGVAHFAVTPCAYEHFALMAAYGAPERVEIRPASREPVTTECPRVER